MVLKLSFRLQRWRNLGMKTERERWKIIIKGTFNICCPKTSFITFPTYALVMKYHFSEVCVFFITNFIYFWSNKTKVFFTDGALLRGDVEAHGWTSATDGSGASKEAMELWSDVEMLL